MRFIRLQSTVLALGLLTMAGFVTNFTVPVAHAQAISGDITGTVTDATKAVVVRATVVAKNVATGVTYTATTGGAGEYRLVNLPPGNYDVTGSAPGFSRYVLRDFAVELNKVSTANIVLQISAHESIEVTAEAGVALDTTTAQLETSFSSRQLTELPAATNNVLNLTLMTAGVSSSGGVGQGTGPAVGGQRPTDNNYTVEGIDNNDKSVPGPLLTVPSDAVAQFTSLQNQYSAEYGHSNGGQFNTIIKSGTNQFHGLAYEYFQNRNLNAIDAGVARTFSSSNPSNARFDDNRFGGQVGGPIFKNKLFFFSNYEQEPIGAPGSTSSFCAPTAAGFTTLAGLPGISSTNLTVYKTYSPVAVTQAGPNDAICPQTVLVGATSIPIGDVSVLAGSYQNNYKTLNSVDYTPSEKDSIRARYLYNKTTGPDTAATFPVFWLSSPNLYHLATLSEFHTFTPNLTNELRIGYNRFYNETPAAGTYPGLDAFPNIVLVDLGVNIGPDPNAPQATIQNTYQGSDAVMYIKGRHTFKGGFEFRDVISPQLFVQRARGDYEWTKNATGQSGLGQFLQDLSPSYLGERNATAPGASPTYYGNEKVMYGYLQDDWKVDQKLTLNLGVRYEYTGVPLGEQQQSANSAASVPGLITFGVPKAQKANFVPRIGFAYSPDSKTVVRGGFGMGYDVLYDNLGILSAAPQYQVTEDVPSLTIQTTGFLAGGGLPAHSNFSTLAQQRASTSSYVPDQKLPYAENWSLGIERTFAQNYTAEVRYVGNHSVHLPTQNRINIQNGINATNHLYESFDSTLGNNGGDPNQITDPVSGNLIPNVNVPWNGGVAGNTSATAYPYTVLEDTADNYVPAYEAAGFYSNIVAFMPYSSSSYHGLASQLTRRFAHGLLFNAAFTWSKTMDDATATAFSTYLTPRRPQDFRNVKDDWSRSALDHKFRFSYAMVYDFPFFKSSGNLLEREALGGWEISPVFTFQTGEYATVQSGYDANLNGDAAGDRAFVNPLGKKGTGSDINEIWDPNLPSSYGSGPTYHASYGCENVYVGDGSQPTCTGDAVGWAPITPNTYYIAAGPGTIPNGKRNDLELPGIKDLDVSVQKRFALYKQTEFLFGAQIWNVINKSQYVPGSINNINSVGYTGTTQHEMLTPGNTLFNKPNEIFNNNARTMQLSLKFEF
jgi:hypothetical protein